VNRPVGAVGAVGAVGMKPGSAWHEGKGNKHPRGKGGNPPGELQGILWGSSGNYRADFLDSRMILEGLIGAVRLSFFLSFLLYLIQVPTYLGK
jgi:hypothetical protein